jgi:hypothetical protein
MKYLKTKSTLLVALLALTSFAATAALVRENIQHKEFERAARMETLSVIALKNGDYSLACKAQRDAVLSLERANTQSYDIYSQSVANIKDICAKAGV